jgi:hypothetical protein
VYDLTFDVTLTTYWQYDLSQQAGYRLVDAPIVMPVIFQGTYSAVKNDSLRARLWLEGREDTTLQQRTRLDDGFPFQTRLAVIPVGQFGGRTLRWQLGYRVESWSSRLTSETAAAAIPWPQAWPEEVQDGLRPQMFIESDDPLFARVVEQASEGKLRLVPPYLAAKDLVRYCINQIRLSGNGKNKGNLGALRSQAGRHQRHRRPARPGLRVRGRAAGGGDPGPARDRGRGAEIEPRRR